MSIITIGVTAAHVMKMMVAKNPVHLHMIQVMIDSIVMTGEVRIPINDGKYTITFCEKTEIPDGSEKQVRTIHINGEYFVREQFTVQEDRITIYQNIPKSVFLEHEERIAGGQAPIGDFVCLPFGANRLVTKIEQKNATAIDPRTPVIYHLEKADYDADYWDLSDELHDIKHRTMKK